MYVDVLYMLYNDWYTCSSLSGIWWWSRLHVRTRFHGSETTLCLYICKCSFFFPRGFYKLFFFFFSGRSWKATELRLKSWDDLQKLWYVLLKEKNMLMTQRQMLHAQNLRFPNPERLPKVWPISFYFPVS